MNHVQTLSAQLTSAPLPYVEINTSQGKLHLLIDTGSNVNLISKKWAYSAPVPVRKTNPERMQGVAGSTTLLEFVRLPLFGPHNKTAFDFHVFDFHTYFNGLVGTDVLLRNDFILDLPQRTLMTNGHCLPIKFYMPAAAPRRTCLAETTRSRLRTEHLTDQERTRLEQALDGLDEVFRDPDRPLSCMTDIECPVRTTDDEPIYQKTYPYPICYRAEVDAQIAEMLRDGIIQPSCSPWNSPIWIVPKKSDASGRKKFRMVIDYRQLNKKTVSDTYPIPEIGFALQNLGGSYCFTVVDLASGFHQIRMKPSDVEKTAFSVNGGKYEFLRMSFGLKNSPATFQRAMDDILRKLIAEGKCLVYIDDVIILGKP